MKNTAERTSFSDMLKILAGRQLPKKQMESALLPTSDNREMKQPFGFVELNNEMRLEKTKDENFIKRKLFYGFWSKSEVYSLSGCLKIIYYPSRELTFSYDNLGKLMSKKIDKDYLFPKSKTINYDPHGSWIGKRKN